MEMNSLGFVTGSDFLPYNDVDPVFKFVLHIVLEVSDPFYHRTTVAIAYN